MRKTTSFPFINGFILIRGGRRDEPAAKTGLVNLYGQTWRTSGTASLDGDSLDDQMENKAASIETNGGLASTSLSWSSLKGDFDGVFTLATDLLLHPAFKEDKLDLAKQQIATGISRRNDSAEAIASREVSMLAYGKNSPYGRETEYSTIDAVNIADLQAWHDRTVIPNGMIVAISGDFDSTQMEAKLRSTFAGLKRGAPTLPVKAEFPGPKAGVFFVEKNDINQSSVNVFGLGTERNNPDLYALAVMNEIFSGGFGSRVVQEVRTRARSCLLRRRQLRRGLRSSRSVCRRCRHQKRKHRARDQGRARPDQSTQNAATHAGRAEKCEGSGLELLHL